jgi:hypothetical protein
MNGEKAIFYVDYGQKLLYIITTLILIGSIAALRYSIASLAFWQAFATGALPFGKCALPFTT